MKLKAIILAHKQLVVFQGYLIENNNKAKESHRKGKKEVTEKIAGLKGEKDQENLVIFSGGPRG